MSDDVPDPVKAYWRPVTGDQYDEAHTGPLVQGLAATVEPGVAEMELLARMAERMWVSRAPV